MFCAVQIHNKRRREMCERKRKRENHIIDARWIRPHFQWKFSGRENSRVTEKSFPALFKLCAHFLMFSWATLLTGSLSKVIKFPWKSHRIPKSREIPSASKPCTCFKCIKSFCIIIAIAWTLHNFCLTKKAICWFPNHVFRKLRSLYFHFKPPSGV